MILPENMCNINDLRNEVQCVYAITTTIYPFKLELYGISMKGVSYQNEKWGKQCYGINKSLTEEIDFHWGYLER